MKAYSKRTLKMCLALLVAGCSFACIVLPILGARTFFSDFRLPYSADAHFRLLGGQLIGPLYTLLPSLALLTLVMCRKSFSGWLWVICLIGPIYTAQAVGGLGHDFSHTVFKECSGIYGLWIDGLSIGAGVSLAALAVLTFQQNRRRTPTD